MGIESTQIISRADAIARIKYILMLVKFEDIEHLSDTIDFEDGELNMSEIDIMLGSIMDETLFRYFEN